MIARAPALASLVAALSFVAAVLAPSGARAEAILQFFETPWAEVEARMPEIAAAGYDAIWLPPPTKGTEGLRDVGFALYDRFDLGDRFQRGTVATRYGSKDDLLALTETAHRFGVRVYFDVIMNHNGNPSTIENVGVDIDMVELDGWPGMSPWDFHVLPAKQGPLGDCAGPPTCQYCAFQPTHDPPQNSVGIADFRVVDNDLSLQSGGWNVCINPAGGEQRVASMTIADALAVNGGDDVAASAILDTYVDEGFTHIVSAPWWDFGGGKKFEEMNWTLLGLFDIATEQYPNYVDGVHAWDGLNAVNGLPLPRFVRHPGRPELYPDVSAGPLPEEDVREMQMRWIRWLMLEAKADGFRLDAIKHVYPSFYGEDFPGDPVAFNAVIQDTYDEVHGNSDADDADLIDDAAIFGEAFTGSCDELKPYIDTGMRALDFPLFNALGQLNGADNDIGQLSAPRSGGGCEDSAYGSFGGLNRRSGVAFAHSHDECQKHESRTTDDWANPEFSRCFPNAGNPDLIYAFLLTRDADATVFFDGNNWTNQSFVRSGRADALGDTFAGGPQRVVVELVDAHRRVARGTRTDALNQQNLWVGSDSYAYERVVAGEGAAGVVVLDDRPGRDATFGNDSQSGSFIFTSFPPGTELVELTGNALEWARTVTVLDPDVVDDNPDEAAEVNAARDNYAAANGAQPPAGYGILYTGFPGGQYVVYAPDAVRTPAVSVQVDGSAAATTTVTTATGKELPDGTLVTSASVEMFVVPAGASFSLEVSSDAAVSPTVVAAQLDGDPALLPGTALASTSEGFLDGFKPLSAGGSGAYTLASIPTTGLPSGVHGVRVRFARDISGAAQAQDEIVLPLCVGVAADCEPREPSFPPPPEVDAGPDPVDDAGQEPLEDSGPIVGDDAGLQPDAGLGEDAGPIDPGGDDDGDDVLNAEDNCPFEQNREQADFDEDGVGDVCDLCPVGVRGRPVDSDGCPVPTAQEQALIEDIARAIAEGASTPASLDLDQSGTIDVSDLDIAIGRAQVPLAYDGGTP